MKNFKNAMALKALVKNKALEKDISAQLVMQNYMMERLLERISISQYQPNLILKGGFLVAALVGLDKRATMDLDTTIKGMDVDKESIKKMFTEICEIDLGDDVRFEITKISEIRKDDIYPGMCVSFNALYPPLRISLSVDVTTGDKITPKEVEYEFSLLFENRSIDIFAYNLETILAEKLETIVSRTVDNTRPRDYYDIYILHKLYSDRINWRNLKNAVIATSTKRGSTYILNNYLEIMEQVSSSDIMNSQWQKYSAKFSYAQNINFKNICDIVKNTFQKIRTLDAKK